MPGSGTGPECPSGRLLRMTATAGRGPSSAARARATSLGGPAAARRLVVVLGIAGLGVLGAGVVLDYLHINVPPTPTFWRAVLAEAARLSYADAEGNAWSWFSALVLAALAAGLAGRAISARVTPGLGARYWVLAAFALFLSLDEGAQVHEFLNQVGIRVTDRLGPFNAWLVPGIAVFAVAGAFLLWLARGVEPALRRRLVVAGLVFVAGAVGMEALGTGWALSSDLPNPWLTGRYHLLVAVEEGLEMLGALIALHAVVARTRVEVPDDDPTGSRAPEGAGEPSPTGPSDATSPSGASVR